MIALSIRQPWAWLIIYAGKDIENRRWRTGFRGRFLVHAAKGMTVAEYEDAVGFAHSINAGIRFPNYHDLARGGVIGEVELVNCMVKHPSRWFCGPYGFLLSNPKPLPFRPVKGALGFFSID